MLFSDYPNTIWLRFCTHSVRITYTSLALHVHFTYASRTLHLRFTYTSLTLHVHITYASRTLHVHFTYTSGANLVRIVSHHMRIMSASHSCYFVDILSTLASTYYVKCFVWHYLITYTVVTFRKQTQYIII